MYTFIYIITYVCVYSLLCGIEVLLNFIATKRHNIYIVLSAIQPNSIYCRSF